MVISPNDFSLWARLTGNKYPSTPRERAQKGPEVQRFIQNLDKEGMIGGKQEEQKKKVLEKVKNRQTPNQMQSKWIILAKA